MDPTPSPLQFAVAELVRAHRRARAVHDAEPADGIAAAYARRRIDDALDAVERELDALAELLDVPAP